MHPPFVHDLDVVLQAPVQAWFRSDGSMAGTSPEGILVGDTRVVSVLGCTPLDVAGAGAQLTPLAREVRSAQAVALQDVVSLPDGAGDPLVLLERVRTADARGFSERLRLVSDDHRPRHLRLKLRLVTDAASMSALRDPRKLAAGVERPVVRTDGEGAAEEEGRARWRIGAAGCAQLDVRDGGSSLQADGSVVTWVIDLETPPRGEAAASWRLDLEDPSVPFVAAEQPWGRTVEQTPRASADPEQRRAEELLRRSLSDLDALRLQVPGTPQEMFFAAGAPWYFTLFGRDSLIAASLTLPVDVRIAEGTLRTLARRQGTEVEQESAQQPGKILHEMRSEGIASGGGMHLPPVYYGTIDATPLWISLLHDALSAGLDESVLHELRPGLEAAALWLIEHADADGDGLIEYIDASGHGLANQGWKDSDDAIRFADGSLATGTIALAEVQGYAYAAALHAADLLERSGSSGTGPTDLPARLRGWARELHTRFHAAFWCEDRHGPFIALALDGRKRAVDGLASNMGHLLGTGLLDGSQERLVVDRLIRPELFSGYGIRTLSSTNGGYGPLRYHGGSVWTHDTGVILRGMLRAGFPEEALLLARGLLRAADAFDMRLPELFGGQGAAEVTAPLPFPASCRPQAWSAATAVPMAQALGVLPA